MNDGYPASTPEYWMRRLQDGREEWRCLENTLSDLRSELAALREDKAILEWLEKNHAWLIVYLAGHGERPALRDAALDAMKGEK